MLLSSWWNDFPFHGGILDGMWPEGFCTSSSNLVSIRFMWHGESVPNHKFNVEKNVSPKQFHSIPLHSVDFTVHAYKRFEESPLHLTIVILN